MLNTIPNMLTVFRIVVIPIIIGLFYIPGATAAWATLFFFALAGASDYFDGVLARNLNQTSAFGKFLDPVADKLVVLATLMMLVAFQKVEGLFILAPVIILLREVTISGLREFLGPYNVQVPVTRLAKWKTTIQMLAIGFLIMGDYGDVLVPHTKMIGEIGIVFATIVTVWTGWAYLKTGYKTISELDEKSK